MSNGGTVVEIEAQIRALRDAQEHTRRLRKDAETLESDGLHAEILARQAQTKARQAIREYDQLDIWFAEELERLIHDYLALIPEQRTP